MRHARGIFLAFVLYLGAVALLTSICGASEAQQTPAKNHTRTYATVVTPNGDRQFSMKRSDAGRENSIGLQQRRLPVSASGSRQNKTEVHALPVRRLGGVQPAAIPPRNPYTNVRHHGPSIAVVAGSAGFRNGNTGALDGTRIHRKP